jgi:hypothetical protein
MNGTTNHKPSEDWHYGTVRAVFDHERHELLVMVSLFLPDPDDDAAVDWVELDWQAFCGDLEHRWGRLPNFGEPEFLPAREGVCGIDLDVYTVRLADFN